MKYFLLALIQFSFAIPQTEIDSHLLKLNKYAFNLSPSNYEVQSDSISHQEDYSWPQGSINLRAEHYFYATHFRSGDFKSPRQALMTLEYLQGISLNAFSLMKGRPLETPWIENCVHHPITDVLNKPMGYSLICIQGNDSWLIFSAYPMGRSWILGLFDGGDRE